MPAPTVISLGGSIVAPDGVDVRFLAELRSALFAYLDGDGSRRLIVVCGGGRICRDYQRAYREIVRSPADEAEDWIGVAATRVNAELVRQILAPHAPDPVVQDPSTVGVFTGRVLVAGGWKPGFSSDYDAVVLAERFGARVLVNLSDIDRVYSADPRADPSARPLDAVRWDELLKLIGEAWKPGMKAPFDPVAARRARDAGLSCIVASGRDVKNTVAILTGARFIGTMIRP